MAHKEVPTTSSVTLGGFKSTTAKPAATPTPEKPAAKEVKRERREDKSKPTGQTHGRLASIDAYRGLVMAALASAGFGFRDMLQQTPGKWWEAAFGENAQLRWQQYWSALARQFSHVDWVGCTFWDMIQPSFMFLVGVSMPFSYAARRERGQSHKKIILHAAIRSLVLIFLGVLLTSKKGTRLDWQFTNVLAQIGLGYLFVLIFVHRHKALQILALVVILAGYGYFFYRYPLPAADFDYQSVGADPSTVAPGAAGHWNKNANAAAAVDRKLLNWFPRSQPFEFNAGGYATLNFVPSIVTMLLGLMAGELLRSGLPARKKFFWLLGGGAICLAIGLAVGLTFLPIVKRIWTPSWTLVSGAIALWILGAFYGLIDLRGWRRWAFPLVVVGANSILVYLFTQTGFMGWIAGELRIILGQTAFDGRFGPIFQHVTVLAVIWLICYWLYRQKAFIKI